MKTTVGAGLSELGDDLVESDDNVVCDPVAVSLDCPVGEFAWQRIAVVTEKIAQSDQVGEGEIGKLRHRHQHDTTTAIARGP